MVGLCLDTTTLAHIISDKTDLDIYQSLLILNVVEDGTRIKEIYHNTPDCFNKSYYMSATSTILRYYEMNKLDGTKIKH